MKKLAGKKKADTLAIDLTPMLDVVFILLIFFVVTATFLSETSISAASSENNENQPPPPQEEDDKKNILFEIGQNDEIILNGNPRPLIQTQIRSNIDQLKAENPDASVIIQPHITSKVTTLVMVMDAARQAGMANISIVEPR